MQMLNAKEEFWRDAINNLNAVSPEVGQEPPEIEFVNPKKELKEGDRQVLVQKIITRIYTFTDIDGKVFASQSAQSVHILGKMTLEEGLKRAQEDKST